MTIFTSGDAVSAIVADIGSYATKIGFAGEDYPRAYFRSNVAVLREEEEEKGKGNNKKSKSNNKNDNNNCNNSKNNNERDNDQSNKKSRRFRRRGIEKVHYDSLNRSIESDGTDGNWEAMNPVDDVTGLWYDRQSNYAFNTRADWADLIPKFLQHGYESSLGLGSSSASSNPYSSLQLSPLLLVERSYNPPPLRQQLLEILMEECQIPATFFARDATLACYANARTTSTVIDIGYSGTTVSPVFEGYVEQKGIRRSPIGSMAMDELALEQLQNICKLHHNMDTLKPLYQVSKPLYTRKTSTSPRADPFHRLSLLAIAQDCRESGAGQSINTAASKTLQVPSIPFTLPDGQTVDVPSHHRFAVADLIIGQPQQLSSEEETPSSGFNDTTNSRKKNNNNNPREAALTKIKNEWGSVILSASAEEGDGCDYDEDGDSDDKDNDDYDGDGDVAMEDVSQSKQQQTSKYTEATAVGVASRRTTRRSEAKQQQRQAAMEHATTTTTTAAAAAATTSKVLFDNRVLQRACASYFTANLDHLTTSPIATMVCDAAFRCDRDQQASVLGNAVLCGGGACIGPTDQAVPDLLREQIEAIIHTHTPGWRVKVLSPSMQERSICSWLGGSILGSLGTFHEMWITKADYEEWGSAIVNRKCP